MIHLLMINSAQYAFYSSQLFYVPYFSEIISVSTYKSMNGFLNAFCAGSNFFHQKFWMPSIPLAVQFSRLAISFFIFLSVMVNSLTRFTLLPSSAFTSSIHSIFGVGSFCSPKLRKSQHLGHFTFALFHCFQSEKSPFGLAGT